MLTGVPPADEPRVGAVVAGLERTLGRRTRVLDLTARRLDPCCGCYECNYRVEGDCILRDYYAEVLRELAAADVVVVVSTGAAAMPDYALRCLLERAWGECHRPALAGRHALPVVVGAGAAAPLVVDDLSLALRLLGFEVTGAVTDVAAADPRFPATFVRAVHDLERAHDEGLTTPSRYAVLASRSTFRDLALRWGHVLRADYDYHRRHGLLRGLTRWSRLLHRLAFGIPPVRRALFKLGRWSAERTRAARLEAWKRSQGRP